MLSKRIIKLVLVVGLMVPTVVASAIPSSGGPLWGALGVPMQANGPLLERSFNSYWIWRSIDRERRLREAWVENFDPNGPAVKPLSFLDDLSLEQFR